MEFGKEIEGLKDYIDLDTPLKVSRVKGNYLEPYTSTVRELLDVNHVPYEIANLWPVVVCADCKHNGHCLTQEFVEEESRIPFDRSTFFCADGERQ